MLAKIKGFESELKEVNIYVAPIETEIEEKEIFEKQILNYVSVQIQQTASF